MRFAGRRTTRGLVRERTPDQRVPGGTTCDSRNVHQPIADGINHEFGGLMNAERIHNVGSMHGDGVGAEIKLGGNFLVRSEEHTSELQSHLNLVCRLLLEKKKKDTYNIHTPYS